MQFCWAVMRLGDADGTRPRWRLTLPAGKEYRSVAAAVAALGGVPAAALTDVDVTPQQLAEARELAERYCAVLETEGLAKPAGIGGDSGTDSGVGSDGDSLGAGRGARRGRRSAAVKRSHMPSEDGADGQGRAAKRAALRPAWAAAPTQPTPEPQRQPQPQPQPRAKPQQEASPNEDRPDFEVCMARLRDAVAGAGGDPAVLLAGWCVKAHHKTDGSERLSYHPPTESSAKKKRRTALHFLGLTAAGPSPTAPSSGAGAAAAPGGSDVPAPVATPMVEPPLPKVGGFASAAAAMPKAMQCSGSGTLTGPTATLQRRRRLSSLAWLLMRLVAARRMRYRRLCRLELVGAAGTSAGAVGAAQRMRGASCCRRCGGGGTAAGGQRGGAQRASGGPAVGCRSVWALNN